MKNKVEELSKILADRYGHGMAEKCVTQAEVALEVLGDRIIQLEQERDALKAHCEQLRDVLLGYNAGFPSHQADKALNATPAQSLAEIQAQAVEPVLLDKYEYFDEHGKYTVVDVEDIKCRIQQLREGDK